MKTDFLFSFKYLRFAYILIAIGWPTTYGSTLCIAATDDIPTVSPQMFVITENGEEDCTEYTGSAPIKVRFQSNAEQVGMYSAVYEWIVYEAGKENAPYIVRHDPDMELTFNKSGTSYISLTASFVLGKDTILYSTETPFTITASESALNVPNTFTPNGDGFNDIFKVKDGYRSIVQFHGYIFNRWGKKLFEWTDISKGWDGKYQGSEVADGVYFCLIEAKGADGRKYHIKKAINLIRKYDENQ